MTRRLGAWDCPYCGKKRILGNVFDCAGCGHPRPRGINFYEIPDGPVVTPEIQKQLGSGGPNWYCEHCDSGNKDTASTCWKCNAPKGSSPSHKITYYKQEDRPFSKEAAREIEGESWTRPGEEPSGGKADSSSSFAQVKSSTIDVSRPQSVRKVGTSAKMIAGGIGAILLIIAVFVIYGVIFNTHNEHVKATDFSWTQNVQIQEFSVVHDTSWSTHPADAYNVQQEYLDTGRDQKIHDRWETENYSDTCYRTDSYSDTCTHSVYHSKTCNGSRSNGDGSFDSYTYECGSSQTETYSCTKSRQVPYTCQKSRQKEIYHYEDIYDNFYKFDVNRWMTIRNYPTSGNNHKPYFYTDFGLKEPYVSGTPTIGQQRKFEEIGRYVVKFTCSNHQIGEDGTFSREYSLEDWSKFIPNGDYLIEVNYFNSILEYPTP